MKKVKKLKEKRPLPKSMRELPTDRKEARKKKSHYWYKRGKDNIVRFYGPESPEGREVARYSPNFPDESELQMSWRLWNDLPDNVPANPTTILEHRRKRQADAVSPDTEPAQEEEAPFTESERLVQKKWAYVIAPSGKCKAVLKNAKWSTLRNWARQLIDCYAKERRHLTIAALCTLAATSELSFERQQKAQRRLRLIFAADWRKERRKAVLSQLRSEREQECEEEKKAAKRLPSPSPSSSAPLAGSRSGAPEKAGSKPESEAESKRSPSKKASASSRKEKFGKSGKRRKH